MVKNKNKKGWCKMVMKKAYKNVFEVFGLKEGPAKEAAKEYFNKITQECPTMDPLTVELLVLAYGEGIDVGMKMK
jgi:hypothetical protein